MNFGGGHKHSDHSRGIGKGELDLTPLHTLLSAVSSLTGPPFPEGTKIVSPVGIVKS